MKYQRTQRAVLLAMVLLLKGVPKTFGKVFRDWCLKQIERDYPLFHWALTKKP